MFRISHSLIGFIEGFLSVLYLRNDIPDDVKEKSKELAERINRECLDRLKENEPTKTEGV